MSVPSASDAPESEIETLRQRLQEADELVGAIMRGAVDAVVVGPDEERKRVLMLSGAYGRYRQIVEDMRQGAVTVSPEGEIIFVNRSFASLLKVNPADLFRRSLQQLVAIQDRPQAALLCAASSRRVHRISIQRPEAPPLLTAMSVVAANDGFTTILVTPLRRSDLSPEAHVVVRDDVQAAWAALVDRTDQPALVASADGYVLHANARLTGLIEQPDGRIDGMAVGDLFVYEDRHAVVSVLESGHRGEDVSEVRVKRDYAEVSMTMTVTAIAEWRVCLFRKR